MTAGHYSDGGVTARLLQVRDGRAGCGGASLAGLTCNVFEGVVQQAFPRFDELWMLLEAVTGSPPRLTGAGPALYCLPSSETELENARDALHPLGAGVYLVQTAGADANLMKQANAVSRGARVEQWRIIPNLEPG